MENPIGVRVLTDADRASPEFQRALDASTKLCAFIRGEMPATTSAMVVYDAVKEIEFWYRMRYKIEVKW